MRINRNDLLTVLKKLEPGLASKEIIEQSNRFIFNKDTIRTYNDNVTIIFPFKTDVKGALPSKELTNIVTKFPDDELDISNVENDAVIIKGRGREASLRIDSTLKLPEIDTSDLNQWHKLPSNFIDAIEFCLFSVSKDTTSEYSYLNITKDEIQTFDSHRCTKYRLNDSITTPFLLPSNVIKSLAIFNPIQYCIRDCWIHFADDCDAVFSCRTIEEVFPDVDSFFEDISNGIEIDLPINLSDIIERSHILQSADEKVIALIFDDRGWIKVVGEGVFGTIKEKIKAKYDGDNMKIYVNPILLSEILKYLKNFTINENKNKILFHGSDFDHLVCVCAEI